MDSGRADRYPRSVTTDEVKKAIESGLPESEAVVTDLTGTGDHFKAEVTCPAFADKTPIQQHKLVYGALGDLMKGPIHALQLTTKPS